MTLLPPIEQWCPEDATWQAHCQALKTATSLVALVWAAWAMGMWLARVAVEQQLHERAAQQTEWPMCAHCGHRLHSKGQAARQMLTWVGRVHWQRQVGRCPQGCRGSQRVPFDEALGIAPHQQTSVEVIRLGCVLSVLMPFELASGMLQQATGLGVSGATLWRWVQQWGNQAMQQLAAQLAALAAGKLPTPEPLTAEIAQMALVIAADGVKVPLRPGPWTPKGKTVWREVKVAVLARLGDHLTQAGETVSRLYQRRLVAVLGSTEALRPRLWLEALRQGLHTAPQVIWLSDGGPGLWTLFHRCFQGIAIGILDFYHAAGQLWQAISACCPGCPTVANRWFNHLRHQLRHGRSTSVLGQLIGVVHWPELSESARHTVAQVHHYLQEHLVHINYRTFKARGFPLGSGMVESACKWLIAQRFKGAGMRWSGEGFDHLLHLRLAWVNGRFDALFSQSLDLPLCPPPIV